MSFNYSLANNKQSNGSVKEPNKFHNYETEKITRKASDTAVISSCLVLPPKIVMHDAFNVILWTSADICVVLHDDLE